MRARFSMGQALAAPFGLLKRRPFTLFVWGLVRVGVAVAMIAMMAPMFGDMVGDWSALDSETAPDMTRFAQFEAAFQALNLLNALLGLVVFNAAMRATWSRKGDGFAFLRLGMDELRVAVASLAIFIGVYLGVIVLVLVGVGLGFAVWTLGEQIAVPVIVGYGVLALLLTLWALARLMLIVPVSVIQKSFAFEAGWALARRQATRLAVTGVLAWLILTVVHLIFVAVVVGAAFAVGAATGVDWSALDWSGEWNPTPQEIQAMVQPYWPLLILVVPAILLTGFADAMMAAPLASAARQLLDSGRPKPGPAILDDPTDDGLSPILPAAAHPAHEAHAADDHGPAASTHEEDHAHVGSDHAHDTPTAATAAADSHGDAHLTAQEQAHGHDAHVATADAHPIAEAGHGDEQSHAPSDHHADAHVDDHHGEVSHAEPHHHDDRQHDDPHHAPKHGDGH